MVEATQAKNVLNTGVDNSAPIRNQILEHNLHFHINDKASRISLDKAFFSRHNPTPHLKGFPSRKLNFMSVLHEKSILWLA